jgi:hypothetical protein
MGESRLKVNVNLGMSLGLGVEFLMLPLKGNGSSYYMIPFVPITGCTKNLYFLLPYLHSQKIFTQGHCNVRCRPDDHSL